MAATTTTGQYYISITGLVVKNMLSYPSFMYYTGPAFQAAAKSDGIISSQGGSYKDVQMTMTVWESREKNERICPLYRTCGGYEKAKGCESIWKDSWVLCR